MITIEIVSFHSYRELLNDTDWHGHFAQAYNNKLIHFHFRPWGICIIGKNPNNQVLIDCIFQIQPHISLDKKVFAMPIMTSINK